MITEIPKCRVKTPIQVFRLQLQSFSLEPESVSEVRHRRPACRLVLNLKELPMFQNRNFHIKSLPLAFPEKNVEICTSPELNVACCLLQTGPILQLITAIYSLYSLTSSDLTLEDFEFKDFCMTVPCLWKPLIRLEVQW